MRTIQEQTIGKLSLILNSKTDKDIANFIEADKQNPSVELVKKTNHSLITAYLQMVDITDEYLNTEQVRQVLKQGFMTLTQKYITYLLLRTQRQKGDVEILVEKLKFLKKYFNEEY